MVDYTLISTLIDLVAGLTGCQDVFRRDVVDVGIPQMATISSTDYSINEGISDWGNWACANA